MKPILLAPPSRRSLAAAAGLALVLAAAGCGDGGPRPRTSAPTSVVPPAATTPVTTPAAPPATTPVAVPSAPAPTSSKPAPTARPTPPPVPVVHFTTPQAAMRYLTAAYNRHDVPALKKVTNASARAALIAMYQEATNLQLTGCSRRAIGDYVCSFRHDYPRGLHRSGHGQATFLAAPADKPGWYMTVLVDCG